MRLVKRRNRHLPGLRERTEEIQEPTGYLFFKQCIPFGKIRLVNFLLSIHENFLWVIERITRIARGCLETLSHECAMPIRY